MLFQFVNYTLSFLMWMILGRGVLGLIAGGRANPVSLAFAKVTDPVFALVRRAAPGLPERWVPAASFSLIVAIRLALVLLVRPAAGH